MEGQISNQMLYDNNPVSIPSKQYDYQQPKFEYQEQQEISYQPFQQPILQQPIEYQQPNSQFEYQQPKPIEYQQPKPIEYQQQKPLVQNSPVKQQQAEYRDYLKKQMEEKEQNRKRNTSNHQQQQQQSQQIIPQQQYTQPPQPPQPINKAKQEYADFLRQQIQEKEDQKRRRINSGQPNQQNQDNNIFQNPPQINQPSNQKQEYGDYLKMQMQMKQQQAVDKKDILQRKFEQADQYPFGKGGSGAPNQRQQPIQQQIQVENYPQMQYQQQYQQPQQPQQYQPIQQQQFQPQYQYQQLNQYQQPPQAQIYNQQPQQQFNYQQTPQQQSQQQLYQPIDDGNNMNNLNFIQPQEVKGGRNRLMMENANLDDMQRKEKQKMEMQRVLQEQIEEKRRKKEEEKMQQEREDRLAEEKFRKEKELVDLEKKQEEDLKKQKQGKFEQDNVDLKEQRRLQRLQERRGRNQQPEEPPQEENFAPFVPPSAPKSENYLKDFLQNEKQKEGVSQDQSIVDFYKNGPQPSFQQNRDIEELKKQMIQQQDNLQRQIHQVMNQAQQAIESRNKAEQDLLSLKQQVQNKYIQEEQHHENLMLALVKNDPKWEKQVFPPHLLAQADMGEHRNLGMPELKENYNLPSNNYATQFQPVYQSKPTIFKEEPREQKQQFREQYGLQSLVSDSNMVPIDQNTSLVALQPPPEKRGLPQIDELNNHFEDSLKAGGEYDPYKFKTRPLSSNQHPAWNVPSIDSEFTKEIDQLLNYKPTSYQRPQSNQKINQQQQRPQSTFNKAAKGILGNDEFNYDLGNNKNTNNSQLKQQNTYKGETYKPYTLDSDFPDLTMAKRTDTLDVAGVHKRMDQKLMQLNEIEDDEDMQKLDKLLMQYNS